MMIVMARLVDAVIIHLCKLRNCRFIDRDVLERSDIVLNTCSINVRFQNTRTSDFRLEKNLVFVAGFLLKLNLSESQFRDC